MRPPDADRSDVQNPTRPTRLHHSKRRAAAQKRPREARANDIALGRTRNLVDRVDGDARACPDASVQPARGSPDGMIQWRLLRKMNPSTIPKTPAETMRFGIRPKTRSCPFRLLEFLYRLNKIISGHRAGYFVRTTRTRDGVEHPFATCVVCCWLGWHACQRPRNVTGSPCCLSTPR